MRIYKEDNLVICTEIMIMEKLIKEIFTDLIVLSDSFLDSRTICP